MSSSSAIGPHRMAAFGAKLRELFRRCSKARDVVLLALRKSNGSRPAPAHPTATAQALIGFHGDDSTKFSGMQRGYPSAGLCRLDNPRALVSRHDVQTRTVTFNPKILAFARHWTFARRRVLDTEHARSGSTPPRTARAHASSIDNISRASSAHHPELHRTARCCDPCPRTLSREVRHDPRRGAAAHAGAAEAHCDPRSTHQTCSMRPPDARNGAASSQPHGQRIGQRVRRHRRGQRSSIAFCTIATS